MISVVADGLTNLGILELNVNNPSQAIIYAEEAQGLYKKLGNVQWQANALGIIGDGYVGMGQRAKAIEKYELQAQIAAEGHFRNQEASSSISLGNQYRSARRAT